VLRPIAPVTPANDDSAGLASDSILDAALRFFSVHGLSTPEAACAEAEAASHRGDRLAAVNWLAICRMFEKRLADDLESRLTHALAQPSEGQDFSR
jgi:hypothetical protein